MMASIKRNVRGGAVTVCACAAACATWAVQVQVPSAGHGQTAETVVTNAAAEADAVVVAGTLRKLGAGRLAVTASHFTGGAIAVEQGALALDAGSSVASAVLPSYILTNSLLLWVDATTNVVTDGGSPAQVLRWCDARETDTAAPTLMYAGRYGEGPGPAPASRAWLGAQQYLEFGAMKSNGCWLALMQPGAGGTVGLGAGGGEERADAARRGRDGHQQQDADRQELFRGARHAGRQRVSRVFLRQLER